MSKTEEVDTCFQHFYIKPKTLEAAWWQCGSGIMMIAASARLEVDPALLVRAACAGASLSLPLISLAVDQPGLAIEAALAWAAAPNEASLEKALAAGDASYLLSRQSFDEKDWAQGWVALGAACAVYTIEASREHPHLYPLRGDTPNRLQAATGALRQSCVAEQEASGDYDAFDRVDAVCAKKVRDQIPFQALFEGAA